MWGLSADKMFYIVCLVLVSLLGTCNGQFSRFMGPFGMPPPVSMPFARGFYGRPFAYGPGPRSPMVSGPAFRDTFYPRRDMPYLRETRYEDSQMARSFQQRDSSPRSTRDRFRDRTEPRLRSSRTSSYFDDSRSRFSGRPSSNNDRRVRNSRRRSGMTSARLRDDRRSTSSVQPRFGDSRKSFDLSSRFRDRETRRPITSDRSVRNRKISIQTLPPVNSRSRSSMTSSTSRNSRNLGPSNRPRVGGSETSVTVTETPLRAYNDRSPNLSTPSRAPKNPPYKSEYSVSPPSTRSSGNDQSNYLNNFYEHLQDPWKLDSLVSRNGQTLNSWKQNYVNDRADNNVNRNTDRFGNVFNLVGDVTDGRIDNRDGYTRGKNGVDNLQDRLYETWDNINDVIQNRTEGLGVVSNVNDVVGNVVINGNDFVKDVYDNQYDTIKDVVDNTKDFVKDVYDNRHDTIKDVVDNTNDFVKDVYDNRHDTIKDVVDNTNDFVKDVYDNRYDTINDVVDNTNDFVKDVYDHRYDTINDVVDNTNDFVKDVYDHRYDTINDVVDNRNDYVKNVYDSRYDRINDALDNRNDYVKNIYDSRYDTMNDVIDNRNDFVNDMRDNRYDRASDYADYRQDRFSDSVDNYRDRVRDVHYKARFYT